MRIKFIKPLPRVDHVIPAGHILDAPEGFARKMVQTGRAVWADAAEEPQNEPPEAPAKEPEVEIPAEEPVAPEQVAEQAEEAPKPKTRRKKA